MNFRNLFFVMILISSCNNSADKKAVTTTPEKTMVKTDSIVPPKINLKETDLADKKDPVCGMPAFKYMEDTTVYKGNIYAFCSKDCKDEFLKNPTTYIAKK